MEMAEHKITVNGYAPGVVSTNMWSLIDEELGKRNGAKKGETIKKYTEDLIALGRVSLNLILSCHYSLQALRAWKLFRSVTLALILFVYS